jgi:tRNA dimethylallyltransferase
MSSLNLNKPLLVIVGPTAVGKTTFSIKLAKMLDAEIISSDSRLIYKGMDIGTAKPTTEQRQLVQHHLIDVLSPDEPWSLTLYSNQVTKCIEAVHRKNKLPILVGGTGQYVRAVLEGWKPPALAPDPHLRNILERIGNSIGRTKLYDILKLIDPNAAGNIEPNNLRRTIRAFEVILMTGKRFSELRQRGICPYSYLVIGLIRPRHELYDRIDKRIDEMIRMGFFDEVRQLLQRGYSKELPAFSAIGYSQIMDYLQGNSTLEDAIQQIKSVSRKFVRRQANWFKPTDPLIHWFQAGDVRLVDEVVSLVNDCHVWIQG